MKQLSCSSESWGLGGEIHHKGNSHLEISDFQVENTLHVVGLKPVILAHNYRAKSRSTFEPVFMLLSANFVYTYEMKQTLTLPNPKVTHTIKSLH